MFVGEIGAVTAFEAIDDAGKAEGLVGEFELGRFAFLVGFEGGVKLTASENAIVGDADFFDFFQIEESFAVVQGVEGHDRTGGSWDSRTGKRSMIGLFWLVGLR